MAHRAKGAGGGTRRAAAAWARGAWLLLGTVAAGCQSPPEDPAAIAERSRQEAARLAEEKKKQPFQTELPTPLLSESLLDVDTGQALACAKPGHWTSTVQSMMARYDDFAGTSTWELVGPEGAERAAPLPHTAYRLRAQRPAVLAKGRPKRVEAEVFLPEEAGDCWLASRLERADGGGPVAPEQVRKLPAMPAFQYFLVVLAREPQRYAYLNLLDAVRAPWEDETGATQLAYRVVLADGNQRMPLPPHVPSWTSVAYVLWDGADADRIDADQRQALLDWIHWGGRLIVCGPSSLEGLRTSFLGPYLPAESAGSRAVGAAELAAYRAAWGAAANGTRYPPLEPARRWAGCALEPRDPQRDRPLRGCEGLCYERDVGLGSVVVAGVSLAEPELVNWAGFDPFFNAALLRRPPRRFALFRDEAWSGLRAGWDAFPDRPFDAHFTTPLRWFARDFGRSANVGPAAATALDGGAASPAASGMATAPPAAAAERPGGLGAWNEFGPVASAARELLSQAAGVRVPGAGFVLLVLAAYLFVLVPLNWMAFHALGRVEWAWIAAPLIAVCGAAAVVHLAQLDIGFVSARTDVAVLELQGDYPRGHLSRYVALYTSLSSEFDLEFADASAVAMPFPADAQFALPLGDEPTPVAFEKFARPRLRDLAVTSASTLLLHSEEMLPLPGPVRLTRSTGGVEQIENRTGLGLADAIVLRRTRGRDGALRHEGSWIGHLRPGEIQPLPWRPLDLGGQTPLAQQLQAAPPASVPSGRLELETLLRLAGQFVRSDDPLHGGREEVRLVARCDGVLPGVRAEPAASQERGAAVVLAHLRWGPRGPADADANSAAEIVPDRRRQSDAESPGEAAGADAQPPVEP